MAFASTATPFTLTSTLAATQKRSSSPAINIAARRIMHQTMVAPGRQLQQQWEQKKEQQPPKDIEDVKPREEEKESVHQHLHEQHDVKCVCELCSCDTHACPRTPRSAERYESSMKSHYGDTYIHHGYDRAPPRVNKSDVEKDTMSATIGMKFYNGHSTFKSDYPAYNVPPPAPAVPLGQSISIVDRDAPFTHTTNYSDQYPYKSMHVPRAKAPPTTFETAGKFEAESVARADYKPWDRCAAQSCRPAQRRTVPDETRDFQTTAASAFNEKGNVARAPIMPFSTPHIESDQFNTTSTVKSDFPDWGHVKPAESCKPKERRDADEPDERQFETEKSSQFRRHNAPPIIRATAPLSHVLDTDTEFYQGVSATRDHFRGNHAEPAQILRPKYTFQPGEEENRNFMSEARSQFPHKHVEVIRAREAPSVFAPEADDRSFQSETSSSMKNHGYHARQSFKPEKEKLETTPFMGKSTNQEMYQKWNEKPRETCAPRHTLKLEEENRDFLTEFGQHYTPKERETCISSTLPDRHTKPTSGHLFYEKKGSAPWKKI